MEMDLCRERAAVPMRMRIVTRRVGGGKMERKIEWER
jgi:hypothetical protein